MTLNQPTLPAEVPLTDAEQNFIEESPPGLFPENQNSNYGLIRKIYTDRVQQLIGQQATIYNERFVETSSQFLDAWEADLGLPAAATGVSDAARRLNILGRLVKGPFTSLRRAQIVENFIIATFGTPIQLSPSGVPLSAGGVPLYAEVAPVGSLYVIRENEPAGRNLLANGNFENNITGWTAISATPLRVTTQNKWGLAALQITASAGGSSTTWPVVTLSGATAGRIYTASVWVKATGSSIGRTVTLFTSETGGAFGTDTTGGNSVILTGNWQRVTATKTIVRNDRTGFAASLAHGGMAAAEVIFLDGAQVELMSSVPTGLNKFGPANFEQNTTGWTGFGSTTLTLTATAHDGAQAMSVAFASTAGYALATQPINYINGRTYTLSAWVNASGSAIGKTVRLKFSGVGGAFAEEDIASVDTVLVSGWQRISVTGTLARDDRTSINVYFMQVTASAFTPILDGVQLEAGSTATLFQDSQYGPNGFVDPEATAYGYEVRIANTVTPDIVGLTRELKRITPASMAVVINQVATP